MRRGSCSKFEEGDFFRLTINGLDSGGGIISSVLFSLAEGADLVDEWTFVDLSALDDSDDYQYWDDELIMLSFNDYSDSEYLP